LTLPFVFATITDFTSKINATTSFFILRIAAT